MDPITKALLHYHNHLREGGGRPNLAEKYPHQPHEPARMFSASAQLLCDRKACFDVLADIGELEPDLPHPDELLLDFRVGNLFEDWIAEAMEWQGALLGWQRRISDGKRKGRTDLLVDPAKLGQSNGALWAVEVKTIKSNKASLLADRAPYPYHIAQAQWYADNLKQAKPVLFYALRATFGTALYGWQWSGSDCHVETWDETFGWEYARTIEGLGVEIRDSLAAQDAWLETGELPPRLGETPDAHPFMCVDKDWKSKVATPSCPFFLTCWGGTSVEPFRIGEWTG